jgi:chromosome segregation ATPase
MTGEELVSAIKALEERAQLAERKIEYSSQLERLERRVKELEDVIQRIQTLHISKTDN